jgi:Beta-lactamase
MARHGNIRLAGAAIFASLLFAAQCPAYSAQTRIAAEELRGGEAASAPADSSAFLPPDGAEDAKHDFAGTLVIAGEVEMSTQPAQLSSRNVLGKDPKIFPAIEVPFFTHQGDLVPVSRDVIRYGSTEKGRSYWDVIVQPGRVWSEPADGGWSRASFPFALVHIIEGETRNGVATFLYDEDEVSDVRFQIVQQTSRFSVPDYFTGWGQAPASYRRDGIADLDGLKRGYEAEVADQFPLATWESLAAKVGADKLEGFESAMNPDEVLVSGLLRDGTLYLKPCKSASGELPYCDRQRFGVWSATKSAATATAMLRFAQKYGPEIFDEKVKDYVDIPAEHGGWGDVTFADSLNMATGIGFGTAQRTPNKATDGYLEGNYAAWYEAKSEAEKVAEGFKSPDLPWGPGEVARYRDQDMFLLGVVLNEYLKRKEGPGADLWTMLVEEVYKPIGIHHAPTDRTIEPDDREGQPMMVYGYYPTLGDLARIAQLYHDRGKHGDEQILHAGKLEELIYGKHERGLPAGEQVKDGEIRYHMAFWHAPYASEEGCRLYIPMMRGWGGNRVVLMPGELTGIRLAKNWKGGEAVNDVSGMVTVGDRLARFCE